MVCQGNSFKLPGLPFYCLFYFQDMIPLLKREPVYCIAASWCRQLISMNDKELCWDKAYSSCPVNGLPSVSISNMASPDQTAYLLGGHIYNPFRPNPEVTIPRFAVCSITSCVCASCRSFIWLLCSEPSDVPMIYAYLEYNSLDPTGTSWNTFSLVQTHIARLSIGLLYTYLQLRQPHYTQVIFLTLTMYTRNQPKQNQYQLKLAYTVMIKFKYLILFSCVCMFMLDCQCCAMYCHGYQYTQALRKNQMIVQYLEPCSMSCVPISATQDRRFSFYAMVFYGFEKAFHIAKSIPHGDVVCTGLTYHMMTHTKYYIMQYASSMV